MKGVIVGAPHGSVEPAAVDYANFIIEQTGAALVIAYGFRHETTGRYPPDSAIPILSSDSG